MDKKYILEKVKQWQSDYFISSYTLDSLTYDPSYAESRWLNKYATAEDDNELYKMIFKDFPPTE